MKKITHKLNHIDFYAKYIFVCMYFNNTVENVCGLFYYNDDTSEFCSLGCINICAWKHRLGMTFSKSASIELPLFLLEYFKLKFKKISPNKHVLPRNTNSKVMVIAGIREKTRTKPETPDFLNLTHFIQVFSFSFRENADFAACFGNQQTWVGT